MPSEPRRGVAAWRPRSPRWKLCNGSFIATQGEGRTENVGSRVPEAFDSFYAREYRGVVALAYALSGSRGGAEDIAQDAFVAAYRAWQRISAFDSPESWVRRVVSNLAVSQYRRRIAEARALLRLRGQREPLSSLPHDDDEFWRAVRTLPRRQAQAIALYYVEDLPVAEIARILGCAEGTVKAHLHKGRSAVARRLGVPIHEDA